MKLKFVNQHPEQGGAVSFVFMPHEAITWQAGQSIRLEVPGQYYGKDERRFTISSAPYEQHITVTTRVSESWFKRQLAALVPGIDIDAYAIEGDFTWRDSGHPLVFVAAGIGITPFHAMLKQRVHDMLPLNAILIYGAHDDVRPFSIELEELAAKHAELQFHQITGRHITSSDIASIVPKVRESLVYVSGPSVMVDELAARLVKEQKQPEERIIKDWFTGNLPALG